MILGFFFWLGAQNICKMAPPVGYTNEEYLGSCDECMLLHQSSWTSEEFLIGLSVKPKNAETKHWPVKKCDKKYVVYDLNLSSQLREEGKVYRFAEKNLFASCKIL